MRRRWFQFDWSIALVLSIALHAALVQWMLHDQIVALAHLLWNGRPAESTVITLTDRPEVRDPGQLGEAHGIGTSIAESPGKMNAASPHDADDQPFLSRDPAGMGRVGDKPSPYTGPTGGAMSAAMTGDGEQLSADAAFPQPQPPSLRMPEPMHRAMQPPTANAVTTTGGGAPAAQPQAAQAAAIGGKNGPTDQKPTLADKPDLIAMLDPTQPAVHAATPPGAPASAIGARHEAQTSSAPTAAAAATPSPSASAAQPSANATDSQTSGAPQASSPAAPTPPHPQVAVASPSAPAASANAPGRPVRSADPAPQADSEIDPFSKTPSVVFRGGKMTVQAGRKSKLTRPALSLSGFWDGVALGHVEVTLHIVLDSTGAVVRADVVKSSGSNEIDNPISVEAYNWWFEPDKDENGKSVATDFAFVVGVFR